MINERSSSLPMLVLLGALVFVYHFGFGLYYALGSEPSLAFDFLYYYAFLCGVVWWLRAEARRYPVKPVYCPGLLVGYGWIIIVPYHLFKTRGLRGSLPILALIGIMLAAYLLALFAFMIFL